MLLAGFALWAFLGMVGSVFTFGSGSDPAEGLTDALKRNTQIALSAEKPYTEESGWGATVAYTFTDAVQNRDINEHYVFDGPSVTSYPFITSNAAAKHRLVATGTARGAVSCGRSSARQGWMRRSSA